MRIVAALALALGGLAALPASLAAHGGHGPTVVNVGSLRYTPAAVEVVAGDTVIWSFQGPDTNHSVTAAPAQAETFDSDPGKSPAVIVHPKDDGFAHEFSKPGTYTYACKVHSTMTGTVKVIPAPPPPPADRRAPRITRTAITPSKPCAKKGAGCTKPGAQLSFRIDEDADVTATLTKKGARKPARRVADIAFKGSNTLKLRLDGLGAAVYTVRLTATDDAKNTRTATLSFRLS